MHQSIFRHVVPVCIFFALTVSSATAFESKSGASIDKTQLLTDLAELSSDNMQGRKTGSLGSERAREYIKQRFRDIDVKPLPLLGTYEQPFTIDGLLTSRNGTNLVAWIAGQIKPQQYLVISAHYDHLGKRASRTFNGADDNASGVAAMLAIAEVAKHGAFQHSIIFLATDAEEMGLLGAKHFVKHPTVALNHIRLNLNLDMLAIGGNKKRLYVYGVNRFPDLAPAYSQSKQLASIRIKKGRRNRALGASINHKRNWLMASDHGAFYKAGIPFLFLGVEEHRYYHTEKDNFNNVDPVFFEGAANYALHLLMELDKLNLKNKKGG